VPKICLTGSATGAKRPTAHRRTNKPPRKSKKQTW
jgi:hypothetical protein